MSFDDFSSSYEPSIPWLWINSGLSNDVIMEQLIPDIQLPWVPPPVIPCPTGPKSSCSQAAEYEIKKEPSNQLKNALSDLQKAERECEILEQEFETVKSKIKRRKPGPRAGARNMMYKKPETYVQIVSKAILSKPERRASLADIYEYVESTKSSVTEIPCSSWKNTVRHTLSTHEFFIRVSKAENGLGYVWSIHPDCVQMFESGNFEVRQARVTAKMNPVKQYCCSRKHKTTNV
ncbi:unnamed protein product [Dimorphilus gyrociliatus]|uniref:Fork-head domain-containing protein n=1 Tax=Dimorphilus gyrociliatus TaxID=2664684 RepID=A0A7I8VCU7_9ANNE|nr:unnamed protein product [Dimorphilus gyrociliatus]